MCNHVEQRDELFCDAEHDTARRTVKRRMRRRQTFSCGRSGEIRADGRQSCWSPPALEEGSRKPRVIGADGRASGWPSWSVGAAHRISGRGTAITAADFFVEICENVRPSQAATRTSTLRRVFSRREGRIDHARCFSGSPAVVVTNNFARPFNSLRLYEVFVVEKSART